MPKCGSQVILCDLPIRFDTYKGCSHNCKYCYTYNNYDVSKIKPSESSKTLQRWMEGKRSSMVEWCDWDIPLHWGGMSDPFQPAEEKHRASYKCLELFAKNKYPFVVSTKSILPARNDYYSLFKKCNFVYQTSMIDSALDEVESGAPTFKQRMNILEKMSKIAQRVVVRIQPYFGEYHKEIMKHLQEYKKRGVYGVIVEGIKLNKKAKGFVKSAGDYVYPYKYLERRFEEIKAECHKLGLVFLCGENRLRHISDSLCCCGVEGLDGFRPNKANLNHYLYDKKNYKFTKKMEKASARCFSSMAQRTFAVRVFSNRSFKEVMQACEKDKGKIGIFKNRK